MKPIAIVILVPLFVIGLLKTTEGQTDSTYDSAWWDTLNHHYAVRLEMSNEVEGLKDLTSGEATKLWTVGYGSAADQSISFYDEAMYITHTRTSSDLNWQENTIQFTEWTGDGYGKFGPNSQVMRGQYVNMSEDIIVRATISTDVTCEVRMDVVDVNGHIGNSHSARRIISPGEEQTYTFDFRDTLYDWYGGDFWGESNGRYSSSDLIVIQPDGSKFIKTYGLGEFIPFDSRRVAKLTFTINDGEQGEIGQEINLKISNIVIGNPSKAQTFHVCNEENIQNGNIIYNPGNIWRAYYGDYIGENKYTGESCELAKTVNSGLNYMATQIGESWFKYTPNATGYSQITAYPDEVNTSINIYSNCSSEPAASTNGLQPQLQFEFYQNNDYYIKLGSEDKDTLDFTWEITEPIPYKPPLFESENANIKMHITDSVVHTDLSSIFFAPYIKLTFNVLSVNSMPEDAFNVTLENDTLSIQKLTNSGTGSITIEARDGISVIEGIVQVDILDVQNQPPKLRKQFDTVYFETVDVYYIDVNLADYIYDPEGTQLSYTVDSTIGSATVPYTSKWSYLELKPRYLGHGTVYITVTDVDGFSTQFSIPVFVGGENRPPRYNCSSADFTLVTYKPDHTFDLSSCFYDSESELTYSVSIDQEDDYLSYTLNGSIIILKANKEGIVNITFSATDGEFTVSETMQVFVLGENNLAPIVVKEHEPIIEEQGFGRIHLYLWDYFIDPEGGSLTFSYQSVNGNIECNIRDQEILEPDEPCSDTLIFIAKDSHGDSAVLYIPITVIENIPPMQTRPIEDVHLDIGFESILLFDLDDLFINPEGDKLEYSVSTSPDENKFPSVTVELNHDNELIINETGVGKTRVHARAIDGSQQTGFGFSVFVMQPGNHLPTIEHENKLVVLNRYNDPIDLADLFTDEDGDVLEFEVTYDYNNQTTIEGSTLRLSNSNEDRNYYRISATDGRGGVCEEYIHIAEKVDNNMRPLVISQLKTISLDQNNRFKVFPVSELFIDIEEDDLKCIITSENKAIADAGFYDDSLWVWAQAPGEVYMDVMAYDDKGGKANTRLHVTFTNTHVDIPQATSTTLLNIYPIPAKDIITVESPYSGMLQIISLNGRVLRNEEVTNGINLINISALPNGIYTISINGESILFIKE